MDTDLRQIRGDSNGVRTPQSWRGVRNLCEFCAAQLFCEEAKKLGSVWECTETILPLTFRDTTGLHHKTFSTIRLGKAWESRINGSSQIVALVHKMKASEKLLGYARVKQAICVTREFALIKSSENHLLIDHPGNPNERLDYLKKTIRRYYGGFDHDGSKLYTVIFLERISDDESQRLKATWPVDYRF